MSRVAVLVAVAAAVLAAGCGPSIGDPIRVLPCTPSEDRLDKQMVLMAQSVPTASAVPCMRAELDDRFLGAASETATSASGPGRPTATGGSTCCPVPVWRTSSS
jgi:hypothetical protein